MFDGAEKKVIVLKNTGSGYFEEAYFIVKEKSKQRQKPTDSDMIKEANRIIRENLISAQYESEAENPTERKKPFILKWFMLGAAFSGSICIIMYIMSNYLR